MTKSNKWQSSKLSLDNVLLKSQYVSRLFNFRPLEQLDLFGFHWYTIRFTSPGVSFNETKPGQDHSHRKLPTKVVSVVLTPDTSLTSKSICLARPHEN